MPALVSGHVVTLVRRPKDGPGQPPSGKVASNCTCGWRSQPYNGNRPHLAIRDADRHRRGRYVHGQWWAT